MTGPFQGLGNAALGMQQSIAQQNQQQVENRQREDQLQVQKDQLKLQQQDAENRRIDQLADATDKTFSVFNSNSRYINPDVSSKLGEMQSDWENARNSFYATGDKKALMDYQAKYPGGRISLTKDGETKVYSLQDIYSQIGTNKPKIDFQDSLDKNLGDAMLKMGMDIVTNPLYTDDERASAAKALKNPDIFQGFQIAASIKSELSPQRALLSLGANGVPETAEGLMALAGTVSGLELRYKNDPEQMAYIERLKGLYDPAFAAPESKADAQRRADLLAATRKAQVAGQQITVAKLDETLLGNDRSKLDLDLANKTFDSTVRATNKLNEQKVGTAEYDLARSEQLLTLLPLSGKAEMVGVLAGLAKTPGIGKAAIESLRNDPKAMQLLGLDDATIDSALTRAGAVTRTTTLQDRLGDAQTISTMTKLGLPGKDAIEQSVKDGTMTEKDATDLLDLADAYSRAEKVGLDVGIITGQNEVTRQTVLGEDIAELTKMGSNVQRITFKNNYQLQAYSLKTVNGKLALDVPGMEAEAAQAALQQAIGASKNAIIVQDGQRQYLAQLTDAQYQLMLQDTKNNLGRAQVEGLYVFSRTEAENKLAVYTAQAGIATQKNILTVATQTAQLVGPEAVSALLASTAGNEAKQQEAANMLAQLSAAAPYMGQLGVQSMLAQIATGKMTVAQADEAAERARLIIPSLPKLIGQQVATELAQGVLTEATAKEALKNLDINSLGTGFNTISALAPFASWDDAMKVPRLKEWLLKNKVTKSLWDGMRNYLADKENGGGGGSNLPAEFRVLDTAELRARQNYEAVAGDQQYKDDLKFISQVRAPQTVLDALAQRGYSSDAIEQNKQYFEPKALEALKRINAYRTQKLTPAWEDYQKARQATAAWRAANPSFNSAQGGTGATSGTGAYTAAPALRSQIEGAASTAGVPAAVFYGFIGAESTFKAKPGNYKGLDYVGYGQVGAGAAADVNAMLKKQGLPALDRNDPTDNLQISAYYLKMMTDKYKDPAMAYAAYNMGAGNFANFLKNNGGKFDVSKLPKETQTGIKNMQMYMAEYRKGGAPSQNVPLPPPSQRGLGANTPPPAPGRAQEMANSKDLTAFGITNSAIYSQKNPDGSVTSFCTRFAREYTERANGLGNRAMSGTWFLDTATATLSNFSRKGALYATDMEVSSAKKNAGALKQGDLVFLNYGNDSLDHIAIYDGNGGFIQHSLPGFQGTTIQGAVNRMTVDQFFAKAGRNARVSFGRVPAQGKAAAAPQPAPTPTPQQPRGGAGTGKGTPPSSAPLYPPTPVKWQAGVPKPSFNFPDLTFEDAKLIYDQAMKVKSTAGTTGYQMNKRGLETIAADLIKAGYSAAQIKQYVAQITLGK